LAKGHLIEGKEHVVHERVAGDVSRGEGEVVGVPVGGTGCSAVRHVVVVVVVLVVFV
jgi:hypothetical protein